ncbi:2Fe-2S iron-sulfur cluster-binding protein [Solidesulfovibrio sp.]|uniref:2Fe-2S iron-sulfur cluster-binding protein n=1 Tax=Solidesulfovibrio sp. TaxID=2910990 RepID=UPI00262A750C|nr:2Fe-2S iron-sulfur cluster-binding protein [Solidesulfovibrio sp.]
MPDLIIDGRPVRVPKGTPVIAAAESLGIVIPRFCWHPALGAAGACRMCAVMFLDGPVKGLEMSCMVPAADGMVVETFHPEAVTFRRRVVELLMANHPHDCPVCDEGGHCLLQDETISGGHALRRFPGRKRTYLDQDLGPFIQHEMNRCIHCYRCARFYQEYCGYLDFGPMQNANRVYFGRFASGPLESPFSGNLADICPTGTLTDKPGRYKSRRWDCQRAPSVCPHCSLGCATVALSRYREVVRVEARENPAVNGHFICDRGRYSFGYAASAERPRQARADGVPTSMSTALALAGTRLGGVVEAFGPEAVAVVGSARSSLETQTALTALARAGGWRGPAFFADRTEQQAVAAALAALAGGRARSLAEIGQADAVLCLGVSPLHDAPMLALSLRQAARAGAVVAVADPRPATLPLPFTHLPLAPDKLPGAAALLTGAEAADAAAIQRALPLSPELWPALERLAPAFAAAGNPVLVFAPALAAQAPADARFGLFPVLCGPNAAGAALVADADAPACDDLARAIEAGEVKGLVLAEADAAALSPRLAAALPGLETLVVLDHLPTPSFAAAKVFLPTQTLFESGGTLCNNEARLQYAAPVAPPGEPVSRDGRGGHPPRDYARKLPGTDPLPAAALCAVLALEMGLDMPALSFAAFTGVGPEDVAPEGTRATRLPAAPTAPAPPSAPPGQGLVVVRDDALFATDAYGRYAPLARAQAPAASVVRLHPDDAAGLGLADGEALTVTVGDRRIEATLAVSAAVARGAAVVPRLPGWAGLPAAIGPETLRRRQP